ncbi:MAG: type II toxin-antitoxin system RelE/ParE family toxin, partial [Syntrophaceae bacterium]|nr:type II toxin-antitoxin system RelE/ParE family toxin [Syntrophaceae bacterium]
MPRKRTITFAESAVKDLEAIRTWYVDQQAPDVGGKIIREIIAQIERLSAFPESGRIVPEFGIVNLREIIFSPFRIVYRLDESKVR